jgi:hypothetical protein
VCARCYALKVTSALLKPLYETAFRARTEFCGDHFDQRIHGLICLPESFDLLNRVKNSRMAATVIESADPGRAPSHNVLGQVHGNLPTQTWGRLIPRDASISQMIGDRGFDLPPMTVARFHFDALMCASFPSRRQDGSGSVHPQSRARRIRDGRAFRPHRPDQVQPAFEPFAELARPGIVRAAELIHEPEISE